MEFLEVRAEVQTWVNSEKTSVVDVKDPEVFRGYMTQVTPVNPRHMADLVVRFQELLREVKEECMARIFMAFQYDFKYFVIYEYFEEVQRRIGLEEARRSLHEVLKVLERLHRIGIYHGGICKDAIKVIESGVKVVGWKLPEVRSFEPRAEVDWQKEDIRALKEAFVRLTGFELKVLMEDYEYDEMKVAKEDSKNEDEKLSIEVDYSKGVWLVEKGFLMCFDGKNCVKVAKCSIPKGSSLIGFSGGVYNIGGDTNDDGFKIFDLNSQQWKELPGLLSKHKYHTTIVFQGRLWVLGGIDSKCCEKYDGAIWTHGPQLCMMRENPTCSVYDSLYIYSNGIEKLVDDTWKVLVAFEWIGCLGINVDSNNILIFGGRTFSEYNENVYIFSQTSQNLSKLREGSSGMFGLFGYILKEGEVTAVNNAGKLRILNTNL